MNDSISRQEAIDALVKRTGMAWESLKILYPMLCVLEELQSAQPRWIPCSKRLPEREGRYVCTYTYYGKKDVLMFRYEDGQFLVPWYVNEITAWYKPLEPWEGGQDDTAESK